MRKIPNSNLWPIQREIETDRERHRERMHHVTTAKTSTRSRKLDQDHGEGAE